MKKIQNTRKYTVEKKHTDILGEKLSEWFGKNCFWVHRKFSRTVVEREFNEMQKAGDHEFTNLMQRIHHG